MSTTCNTVARPEKVMLHSSHSSMVDLERGTNLDTYSTPSQLSLASTLVDKKAPVSVSVKAVSDGGWDGPDDPQNPKNWSKAKKWLATMTVALFAFASPAATSMVAPALDFVAADLAVPAGFQTSSLLSIFMLAFTFGLPFMGPLSEVFGRRKVLLSSVMVFLVFCLACGFAQNQTQFLACRFISGLGGSGPLAIGPGVLADLWKPEQRGTAVGFLLLGQLLGPSVGPIFGGLIVSHTTWRWVFWSMAIFTGLVSLVSPFVLPETYAPTILKQKAKRIAKSNPDALKSPTEDTTSPLRTILVKALKRPITLLVTQPTIQLLTIYQLYNYGLFYIVLTTFPLVWTTNMAGYNESAVTGSLNYISIGLGLVLASLIAGPLNDKIYVHLKNTRGRAPTSHDEPQGRPEFRVPLMFPASLLIVTGLLVYGWSTRFHAHWLVPNAGMFLFSFGYVAVIQCANNYNIDTYTSIAASSNSAIIMVRSIAGFAFPLFAPALYDRLGLGWGNSLLACTAAVVGVLVPLVFWFFGERLRAVRRDFWQ